MHLLSPSSPYLAPSFSQDPRRNYVFGYHPHGIISLGASLAFGTEALNVSRMIQIPPKTMYHMFVV